MILLSLFKIGYNVSTVLNVNIESFGWACVKEYNTLMPMISNNLFFI